MPDDVDTRLRQRLTSLDQAVPDVKSRVLVRTPKHAGIRAKQPVPAIVLIIAAGAMTGALWVSGRLYVGTPGGAGGQTPSTTVSSTPGSQTSPSGGISEQRAISIAREYTGGNFVRAMAREAGALALRFLPSSVAANTLVWAVEFQGPGAVCPPAPAATCAPYAGTNVVVLDYQTGKFLFSQGQ